MGLRTLADLIADPDGRFFLAGHRIYTEFDAFVSELAPPRSPLLAAFLGDAGQHPIWAGQQLYVDCTRSMVVRMEALRRLEATAGAAPFFLWVDTDRVGSDWAITRFHWPLDGKQRTLRVCSNAANSREMRFTELDPAYLQETAETLSQYYLNPVRGRQRREQARRRLAPVREFFSAAEPGTLSEFNYRLSHFLLAAAGIEPRPVLLSQLLAAGVLTPGIEQFLNHVDEVVAVFNEDVANLRWAGVDPLLRPLPADYLPLNYACPRDNRRLRLRCQVEGDDRYAVTTCQCGRDYRFHLGGDVLSLAELAATERWSPDVMLTLFLDEVISGYVGGASSTIYYGLVMGRVIEKVFGRRRVPILIPPGLVAPDPDVAAPESLLYWYLHGG